jgi:hypothetical protein
MTAEDRERLAGGLVQARLNPASADGRAGLGALLRELERASPGALRRISAEIEARLR